MNKKISKDFESFIFGVLFHAAVWILVVSFDVQRFNFLCDEESCYLLILLDLPFSLIYAVGGQVAISKWSLMIGSIWWGFLFLLVIKFIRFFKIKRP
ncbi:hypothetical protein [Desulfuromonas sp.]|uniref:hypothetical protein n=1 Tax=Desulfuromonas sp. TaxID=892 RepID=UPI0025BF42CF|nr:hypothetical protein [Desulfuromonas sp.]